MINSLQISLISKSVALLCTILTSNFIMNKISNLPKLNHTQYTNAKKKKN